MIRNRAVVLIAAATLAGWLLGSPGSANAETPLASQGTAASNGTNTMEQRLAAMEQLLESLNRRLATVENASARKTSATPAALSENSNDASLAAQVDALDQKIRVVERQRELEAEDALAKTKTATVVSAGSSGFSIESVDGNFALNLHGTLQADTRLFPNGAPAAGASTFAVTKIRPSLDGTLFKKFSFRVMPDFGSGSTSIQDAYVDATMRPWLKFRAGKFKGPVGLERLVSDTDIEFYERSLATNLVPNRDVGAQLFGDLWGGTISYAGGIFNGVADGGSTDLDTDNHREFEGRVFLSPFRKTSVAALQGFGFGLAGTSGRQAGTIAAPVVAAFKDSAQQTIFRYRSDGTATGTVLAAGSHSRISPQAYYYLGPFGAWGEYVLSSQEVRKGAASDAIDNTAWQAAASYVLTGEKASPRSVAPLHAFNPRQHAWGAIEIAARYHRLDVDKSAFPLFADPLSAASGARSWTLGVNCYANRNVKIVLNYEQTSFETVEGGVRRKQEHALLERLQLAF